MMISKTSLKYTMLWGVIILPSFCANESTTEMDGRIVKTTISQRKTMLSTRSPWQSTSRLLEDSNMFTTTEIMETLNLKSTEESGETILGSTEVVSSSTNGDWIWTPVTWSWWLGLQMVSVVLGLLGNSLVIMVLFERRSAGSSADAFIGNLATADFLTSLFLIPLPRASRVPSSWLGMLYCKVIFTSILLWFTILTSTFTLMAISIERFVAIVYPIHFARFKKGKHVKFCIAFVWFSSFIANIFIPLMMNVNDQSHECQVDSTTLAGKFTIGVYAFLVCYAIPMLVMIVTNVTAARSLHRQFQKFRSDNLKECDQSTASTNLLVAKKRVLYMLIIVIVIFCICWGPNSVAFFLYNIRVLDSSYLYGPIDRIMVLLAFYNSCANPIVYTLRYPRFRKALRQFFTSCSTGKENAMFEFHGSTSSKNSTPFKRAGDHAV